MADPKKRRPAARTPAAAKKAALKAVSAAPELQPPASEPEKQSTEAFTERRRERPPAPVKADARIMGMADRRRPGGQPKQVYKLLKKTFIGLSSLVVLGLLGLFAVTWLRPELSGPAYLTLINLNFILLGLLVVYGARRVLVMFLDRRGRLQGGRLHLRLLGIFSVLAVVPAVVVAAMSVYLLNQGIESWFSEKVNGALEGSLQVAQAYLNEHEKGVLLEAEALTREPILRSSFLLDNYALEPWLARQTQNRRLDDIAVVNDSGQILASSRMVGNIGLPPEALAMLRSEGVAGGHYTRPEAFQNLTEGRVVAVAPLNGNLWLVAQRWINPAVLARVDQTNAAYVEYYGLKKARGEIRLAVSLFLLLLTGGALASAIWAGIALANRIVRPVTALVHATNRVSAGDLDVRLNPRDDDELGVLTQSFNRMALQLQNSQGLLEKKNRELDDRRRQMEAVLTGVTAGVMNIDDKGVVRWANHVALNTLDTKVGAVLLTGKVPEYLEGLTALLAEAMAGGRASAVVQKNVKIERQEGDPRTLLVRVVPQYQHNLDLPPAENLSLRPSGMVLTFDDITPLIGAQRLAAWRDVARRLAHEIKNPLTPIQVSAERMRRKYLSKLPEEDQPLFSQLAETIVRQTEDMRRMTNEFSDFARMPVAVMQAESLTDIISQAVVLQRAGRPGINFELADETAPKGVTILADRGQVNRVLVNILENAVNAIQERPVAENGAAKTSEQGIVTLVVKKPHSGKVAVVVQDNGRGLPPDVEVENLFDPYVTTRKGGTGLGLAIVRKVMDEHGGTVRLTRRAGGGTQVELTFPLAG